MMQRISVYIPEETKIRIVLLARSKGKSEAKIIRDALDEGLDQVHPKSASAQALLDFANEMEKIPTKGKIPKVLIENLDYYTWGGKKGE